MQYFPDVDCKLTPDWTLAR
ncbi:hypothetical protein R3I94_020902 [Phoxinus phoxinus]|uniref:Uncharacterized protein n=1 Tax=Phoxinus phoxinus TaxID=58324 RepID=A0AAN9C6X1_9TELE